MLETGASVGKQKGVSMKTRMQMTGHTCLLLLLCWKTCSLSVFLKLKYKNL